MKYPSLRPVAWACAALIGLASTGLALAQKATVAGAKPQRAQLAAELAATLQACSYDGSPLAFSPPDLSKGGSSGKQVVAEIMRYTGLPANFVVVEGQVPNAAAVIMAGPDKVPRRVIAYNPAFMGEVIRATQANNWAPVSIMAHEAGHHLAGHTIQPGGSQPPIELEADKFSGFVLYKMGASRDDALKAINTLVPEAVPGDSTHPGRRQRAAAVGDGWDSACRQTGRGDCTTGVPGSAPPSGIVGTVAQSPVAREPVTGVGTAPSPMPAAPAPAPAATPASTGWSP